jgi:hypothetical protein
MGVNEKGFAILNSNSEDLPSGTSGYTNGSLMEYALGNCATATDFEHILDNTNATGRKTNSNYGIIDSTGAAVIFETAGNEYWKYDANDSTIAPDGYVLRTNFAFNGEAKNGLHDGIYSIERYRRTVKLIGDFHSGDSLNYHSIIRTQMRDFSDFDSKPVPVPYPYRWQSDRPFGYIYCAVSICRTTSVSAAVIQGVRSPEPAKLSTLWAILGQPASAIAVPYWPVGRTPAEANGSSAAPLGNIANQIKSLLFDYLENNNYIDSYKLLDGKGKGLWTNLFPAEDSIFTASEIKLDLWRSGSFSANDMLATEASLARYALTVLQHAYNEMRTPIAEDIPQHAPDKFALSQNYPNPFNSETTIDFAVPEPSQVTLKIFNALGQEVMTLISRQFLAGSYRTPWDAREMMSGIYFYQLSALPLDNQHGIFVDVKKLILIK